MVTFTLNTGPHGTAEVFEHLKVCAKNMFTDNYESICSAVDERSHHTIRIAPIGIGSRLGYIRSECIRTNVPWINALAVGINRNTPNFWRPSDGFLPQDVSWNPSHETLWRGMVIQVFSYDWSHVTVQ